MYRLFIFVFVIICLVASVSPAQSPCKPPALAPPPPGSNMFTDELEVALGDAMAEQTEKNYGIIEDEALTAYLNQIGQRIIRHLPPNNLRFRFSVVDLP